MERVRVILGSDHAGFQLKEYLKGRLIEWGYEVEDMGAHSEASVDYAHFGEVVGRRVVELQPAARGVCVCASGLGIAMAANKVTGARAAPVGDVTAARLSRLHNDANVLCLGERLIGQAVAEDSLRAFLETRFEGGRHEERIRQLDALK